MKEEISMITAEELELLEKKLHNEEYCSKQGSKILTKISQQIRDASNFGKDSNNWSDYNEWDQYSVWSKN